jgi:hypothetical protein
VQYQADGVNHAHQTCPPRLPSTPT